MKEIRILRKYYIQKRDDYTRYNKICGMVTRFATRLSKLMEDDPVRIDLTSALLEKWFLFYFLIIILDFYKYNIDSYNMGLIDVKKSLVQVEKMSASKFCRRRLPVVMNRLRMSQNLQEATKFIEQGRFFLFYFFQ